MEELLLKHNFKLRGHEHLYGSLHWPDTFPPQPAEASGDHWHGRVLRHGYDLAKSPQPTSSGPTAST